LAGARQAITVHANPIRLPRQLHLRPPAIAALVVFVLAVPALAVVKAHNGHHYSLSHADAVKAARGNRHVAPTLRGQNDVTVRVTPLDETLQRVTFFQGGRVLENTVVDPKGRVVAAGPYISSGSRIAHDLGVLVLLTLVFVLATASLPILSLRNLDVLALAAFTPAIRLLDLSLLDASLYLAYLLLGYLAARAAWIGLHGPSRRPQTALLWHLTRNLTSPERNRILAGMTLAAATVIVMVVYSSTGSSDVAYASMAGATSLLHGVAPYGHLPNFIVHGDTYPLLNYVFYIPGALLLPVHDYFSDPSGALIVDIGLSLGGAAGLFWIARRLAPFGSQGIGRETESARFAGMRLALAWLTFPALILSASSGSNDPLLAACLIASLVWFSRRWQSAFGLGVAAWVKVAPLLALPIWLARLSRRELATAIAALAGLSAALCGFLLILNGTAALSAMVHGLAFQAQRGSITSLWIGLGFSALQPVAGALLLALVAAATLAVRRDPKLKDDLPRMSALLAAVLLLSQITANYWTWAYLPWALVPLLVSMFGPSAVPGKREPAIAVPEEASDGWVVRRLTRRPAARR
jgi:Glycosyltransferase family 87